MSSLACGSLAVPDSWDFGAGPYGHERLVLPARQLSHDRAGSVPALSFRSLAAARRQILAHGAVTGPHPDGPDGPLSAQARLFSFRWMIGHQTAFILWQLLARDLAAATSDDGMAAAVASRLGCFIDGYSAMLLYCGSCPRQVYHDVIRVSMEAHYSGFSGSWARDYGPVRKLLRDRTGGIGLLASPHSELNEVIHERIARKLVPSGTSLFQAAASKQVTRVWRRSELFAVYDSYFLTSRVSVPVEMVLVQLARRLRAIRADLAVNGLYPAWAASDQDEPTELSRPEVLACKRGLPELLYDIKASALSCAAAPALRAEQTEAG